MFWAGPNFFVPDQKSNYILWQLQTFCARQKDDLHSVKLVFVQAQKFLKILKIFGLAQKIWPGTKHFGTCKRTRQKTNLNFRYQQVNKSQFQKLVK